MATDEAHDGHVVVTFEGSILVPCDPAAAFAIADMATLSAWNPAVDQSELVSGERFCEGARYSCVVSRGPFRLTAKPVLIEVIPNEFVRYSGKFGFAESEDSIRFVPEESGTRVTFRNRSQLPRWTRPMRPFIAKTFNRQANRALAGAARYLAERNAA